MNDILTELVFILDMSGSMSPLTDDTIGGYNSLLKKQKDQHGDANITTVLFDDRYMMLHDGESIENVKNLTNKEYVPWGTTAMLDAVGKTIAHIDHKMKSIPEEKRAGKVFVTIMTDGMENASREYSWESVQSMIKEKREKYNWIFTFIGSNIDTKKVSKNIGINPKLSRTYTHSKEGTDSVFDSVSDAMSYSRELSPSENFSKFSRDSRISDYLDKIE